MANNSRRTTSRSNNNRSNTRKSSNSGRNNNRRQAYSEPVTINPDIVMLITVVVSVLLFLCNIHVMGSFGDVVAKGMFGLFGLLAYAVPFVLMLAVFFGYASRENFTIRIRLISGIVFLMILAIMFEEIGGIVRDLNKYSIADIWKNCANERAGGGVILGSLAYVMDKYLSMAGTILVCLILAIICIIVFMGRQMIGNLREGSRIRADRRREEAMNRRMAQENDTSRSSADPYEEEENLPRYARKRRGIGTGMGSENAVAEIQGEELVEVDKTPRINKKVSGVMADTSLKASKEKATYRDDMHEITALDIPEEEQKEVTVERTYARASAPYDELADVTFGQAGADTQTDVYDEPAEEVTPVRPARVKATLDKSTQGMDDISKNVTRTMNKASSKTHKKYVMPSINLLNKSSGGFGGSSKDELMQTAKNLQDTLETFGVMAKIIDISQGPSVTRFELQPEVGVRVNKIVSLADDLKLALAATDIRIEAPIPGKSAVGIEVPNKEASSVGFRELIEDNAFKKAESKISFAVGKDIAGNVVVTDIAKMPHMLIAGATGSGKSVCINTIIMSILYKAHPDEVKLIMIDPKVVELSVYNGIPHLMVPVVTDPKKAAAALHWGVAEMTKRFNMFAELHVRDLKGYNKAVEAMPPSDDPEAPKKLPQIVIIVDELADLMMVAAKEVEESICRLAQLARACGIHLIIATQRPSVDVITGLIKANMPSRVAFAVSSGVDSRTILDMNGAEKLLGKGDMLFYPQGYPKPARVQGAFVSDGEVVNVVNFLKEQGYLSEGQEELVIKMDSMSSSSGAGSMDSGEDERDELFALAGEFIIDQGKASIGSLQRKFKVGFNRAARIMDQLYEAGVVGADEGTKPRQILMSPDEFAQYVEDYV